MKLLSRFIEIYKGFSRETEQEENNNVLLWNIGGSGRQMGAIFQLYGTKTRWKPDRISL